MREQRESFKTACKVFVDHLLRTRDIGSLTVTVGAEIRFKDGRFHSIGLKEEFMEVGV